MTTNRTAPARTDYPALDGRPVTDGHARLCRENGHATHTVNGTDTGTCPRCGEVTTPGTIAPVDPMAVVLPAADLTPGMTVQPADYPPVLMRNMWGGDDVWRVVDYTEPHAGWTVLRFTDGTGCETRAAASWQAYR